MATFNYYPSPLALAAQYGVSFEAKSGAIDFMSTGAGGTAVFDMPLITGKFAVLGLTRVITGALSGTATGSWIASYGNSAGVDNMITGVTVAASVFNTSANGITPPFSASSGSTGNLVDVSTTPLSVKTTTALTGASSCTGYVVLILSYV